MLSSDFNLRTHIYFLNFWSKKIQCGPYFLPYEENKYYRNGFLKFFELYDVLVAIVFRNSVTNNVSHTHRRAEQIHGGCNPGVCSHKRYNSHIYKRFLYL